MLWGHKPVYAVTLWGLASLMATKFSPHFSVMICFKVRLRVSLHGMNVSQCNVLKSDGKKRVCVCV